MSMSEANAYSNTGDTSSAKVASSSEPAAYARSAPSVYLLVSRRLEEMFSRRFDAKMNSIHIIETFSAELMENTPERETKPFRMAKIVLKSMESAKKSTRYAKFRMKQESAPARPKSKLDIVTSQRKRLAASFLERSTPKKHIREA